MNITFNFKKFLSLFKIISQYGDAPALVALGSAAMTPEGAQYCALVGPSQGLAIETIDTTNENIFPPQTALAVATFPYVFDVENDRFSKIRGRGVPNNIPDNTLGMITASILYGWDFDNSLGKAIRIIDPGNSITPTGVEAQETAALAFVYDPGGNEWIQLGGVSIAGIDTTGFNNNEGAIVAAIQCQYNRQGSGAGYVALSTNESDTLLPSAVRATTTNGSDQTNFHYKGLHVIFDITAVPGVDTVLLTIQGKDPVSGKYYTILAGAAEVGIATRVYKVCPGITAAANVSVSDLLPRDWRIIVTHSGAGNFTYSVGAQLVQ